MEEQWERPIADRASGWTLHGGAGASRSAVATRSGEALGRRPIHLLRRQHLRFLRKSRPIWKLYIYIYLVCVCATKTFHFARISCTQMCLKVFYRLHLVAESALGTRQAELLLKSVEEDGAKAKVVGRPEAGVVIPWAMGCVHKDK